MNYLLEGKAAIVTGGGTGIGEAICMKFAQEGAKVIVNGLAGDPIEDVAVAIRNRGHEAIAVSADVSSEEHAKHCAEAAIEHFGKLDVLINNAGILLVNAETDEFPVEQFDLHCRYNVRSAFLMTKFALPRDAGGSRECLRVPRLRSSKLRHGRNLDRRRRYHARERSGRRFSETRRQRCARRNAVAAPFTRRLEA